MARTDHDNRIASLQLIHVINVLRSSHVCGTFRVKTSSSVHCHHVRHIVRLIVPKRLRHEAAVGSIDTKQTVSRIRDFVHSRVDFAMKIAVNVLEVKLTDRVIVIAQERVTLRRFLG